MVRLSYFGRYALAWTVRSMKTSRLDLHLAPNWAAEI